MAQLLEDFGESQEGTDCQLCEIRSEKAGEIKKTETIIVQDSDSVEQNEPLIDPDDAPEVTTTTTTPVAPTEEIVQEEPHQDACPQQLPEPQKESIPSPTSTNEGVHTEPTTNNTGRKKREPSGKRCTGQAKH